MSGGAALREGIKRGDESRRRHGGVRLQLVSSLDLPDARTGRGLCDGVHAAGGVLRRYSRLGK